MDRPWYSTEIQATMPTVSAAQATAITVRDETDPMLRQQLNYYNILVIGVTIILIIGGYHLPCSYWWLVFIILVIVTIILVR